LGVVGQEALSVKHSRRLRENAVRTQAQPVEDLADVPASVRGNPILLNGEFACPQDFLAVQIFQCQSIGGEVLPPTLGVAAVDEQAFVFGLRHPARRATHALVGAAFIRERPNVPAVFDHDNDDLSAPFNLDAMNGDVGGRLKAINRLCHIPDRLVGDSRSLDGPVGPNPEKHRAAGTVQEGAKRLHAFP
jgi:hypothetical protein